MKGQVAASLVLVLSVATASCDSSNSQKLAGYYFDFPDHLLVEGPEKSSSPRFDDDLAISVQWREPVTNRPLSLVRPIGGLRGPSLEIVDIADITFASSGDLNDPELGFEYVQAPDSEIAGLTKFVHTRPTYRLVRYFDERDRQLLGCNFGRDGEGMCFGSAVSDDLVIQYRIDAKDLACVPVIETYLVELVRSWVRRPQPG